MFLALFLLGHIFVCNHDQEEDKWLRSSDPEPLAKPSVKATGDFNPKNFDLSKPIPRNKIRFGIDMTTVKAGPGYSDKTVELTAQQADVISKTVNSMLGYVSRIVSVTPYLDQNLNVKKFSPKSLTDYPWLSSTEELECDLYVVVIAGPFEPKSNTLANAKTLRKRGDETYAGTTYKNITLDYRMPLAGQVNINRNKLPSEPQDEKSGERQFFVTIVHEFMHVLAFSNSHFNNWVNRSTGEPRPGGTIVQIKNGYDMTQKFVHTEGLTKWVNDRFEVTDPALQELGLELEDGGGSGTKGSHPNSRLYFTDVMQGKTYGPGWISPIYFYTLIDSGWYDSNPEDAEDLVFLNARMHGTSPPNQNVLVQPPMTNYIPDYICQKDTSNYCFYDHSVKGTCDIEPFTVWTDSDGNRHKSKFNLTQDPLPDPSTITYKWYNPLGLDKLGSEALLDYNTIIVPINANCRSKASAEVGDNPIWVPKLYESYSTSSVCAMSTIFKGGFGEILLSPTAACYEAECTTNNQLSLIIKGEKHRCGKKGERIFVSGKMGHAICPNPKEACANLPKRPVLNVDQIIPDRGPINGQNYITFIGQGFNKYTPSSLEIKIGSTFEDSYQLEIVRILDNSILAKFPDLTEDKVTKMIPQSLFASDNFDLNQSQLGDVYTFVDTSYPNSAGYMCAKPTALLMAFVFLITVIIL